MPGNWGCHGPWRRPRDSPRAEETNAAIHATAVRACPPKRMEREQRRRTGPMQVSQRKTPPRAVLHCTAVGARVGHSPAGHRQRHSPCRGFGGRACSALLCNPQPAASPCPFAPRCFFPVAGARRTTEPCALLIIRQTARPDCSRPDAGSPPGRSLELAAEDAATIRPAKSGGSSELLSHPGAS